LLGSSVNNSIADLDVLGIENYFLMKFLEPSIYDIPTVENSPLANELKVASGGTNYLWTGPNGFTLITNPTIPMQRL
jgi:hypothetical protein